MKWTNKRRPKLSDDLDLLIGDIGANTGICPQLPASSLIKKHNPMTASDFASSMLYAEGMDVSEYSEFRPILEEAFRRRYGERVSVEVFEDNDIYGQQDEH